MSQIVDSKGVVPLKSVEAVVVFYVTGWVGGRSQYVAFVQYPPGVASANQWSGEDLDRLCQKQHVDNDLLAEVCGLWREFRRDYEDNQWVKRATEREAKVRPVQIVKSSRTLVH